MGNRRPRISVVVPAYNEESSIHPFLARLIPVLEKIENYEVLFCVDPSTDHTEQIILQEIERNSNISMLVFSRRFGQPPASLAGIFHANGESCVVIDVDLQDPPEVISQLYAKLREGYEVVYAKRRSRKGETWLKMLIARLGYQLINQISDVNIPRDAGDFRIMSRRVIEELRKLNESHGFLRGLVAFVGFKQTCVEYDRAKRVSGKGKYNPFTGSLKIGWNGLVGYSNFLLSLSFTAGLLIAGFSMLVILYILAAIFFFNVTYPLGIPTIVSLVVFMGGVQLISIGILGEYIGRIYDEVKRRPQYIIDKKVNVKKYETDHNDLAPVAIR